MIRITRLLRKGKLLY
ncbi:unnamed protein product [Larinioides sclopetarius]|uniref:Uncharacterized protein n=1 Tax=Larinioides sclopetarius TaxID=280406 RepID=A0AAV2BP16_9ARAC